MIAVSLLSILSLLLVIVLCIILCKKKRVRRVKKIPLAEDLGSSEVIFINSRRKEETKFD